MAWLYFIPSVVLALAALIGWRVSYWRQNRRRTVIAAFEKARDAYVDALARRDTRDQNRLLAPLQSAMKRRLEMGL